MLHKLENMTPSTADIKRSITPKIKPILRGKTRHVVGGLLVSFVHNVRPFARPTILVFLHHQKGYIPICPKLLCTYLKAHLLALFFSRTRLSSWLLFEYLQDYKTFSPTVSEVKGSVPKYIIYAAVCPFSLNTVITLCFSVCC